MTPRLTRFLGAVPLALLSATAAATWEVETAVIDDTPMQVALVRNAEGDTLQLHRDADNILRAELSFHKGFSAAQPSTCVTMQVDKYQPAILRNAALECETRSDGTFVFSFGPITGEQVTSGAVARMLFGMSLVLRYRLERTGYHESKFTLRGSGYAINSITKRAEDGPAGSP